MDPADLVRRFNDRINGRDAVGLAALMADDHAFVDTVNSRITGRDACVEAWTRFFAAFPDYRNEFDGIMATGDLVAVQGRSVCSDARLAGPALWTARVVEGRIAEWRVLDDTPDNRRRIGLEP